MATNWTTERISKTLSNLDWDDVSENWEDITTLYYDWTTWVFSGKATARDTD